MQVELKNKLFYKVEENEDISDVCKKLKVEKEKLLQLNNITQICCGDVLCVPKGYKICYVIKPFDDAVKIAEKLNLDKFVVEEKLKKQKIFVGQKLFF